MALLQKDEIRVGDRCMALMHVFTTFVRLVIACYTLWYNTSQMTRNLNKTVRQFVENLTDKNSFNLTSQEKKFLNLNKLW